MSNAMSPRPGNPHQSIAACVAKIHSLWLRQNVHVTRIRYHWVNAPVSQFPTMTWSTSVETRPQRGVGETEVNT